MNEYTFRAEDAHEAAAVEWWFFQGWFEGAGLERRHFMTSFFRSNLMAPESEEGNVFELMLAVLDPGKSPRHRAVTWIDRPFLRKAINKLKTQMTGIDPLVQKALLQELIDHGPPQPVTMNSASVRFSAAPLAAEWDSYHLAQRADGIHLAFPDPHTGKRITTVLAPGPSVDLDAGPDTAAPAGGMTYRTYPRLSLSGFADDGQPIVGEVWFDHQWADTNWCDWFVDKLPGWDWFGVSLDDGSDLVVLRHWQVGTGESVGTSVHWRDARGRLLVTRQLTLTPIRYWESPTTHSIYPVAWHMEAPELNMVLEFEPLVDDQEVPAFGTPRAVWEGAGTVQGMLAGRQVTGRARGEFHGYAFILDHDKVITYLARKVDQRLEELLPRQFDESAVLRMVGPARGKHEVEAYTHGISVPVWDLIDRSGKRWRPLFGLLLLEALGVPSGPYTSLISCMTEMVHTATLIVDDIEDESLLRRGAECLHLRYGTDVALNAGNAIYFLPSVVLFEHPLLTLEQRWRLLRIKEQMFIEGHCGQATDIYWSRRLSMTDLARRLSADYEGKLLQMYALKTASAGAGVAQVAAVLAHATPEITCVCSEFARTLGTAFQIVDDVHNFARESHQTEDRGEDVSAGKVTYAIATALRRLDPRRRSRLAEIICSPALRQDRAVREEAVLLVEASGALESSRQLAIQMVQDAWTKVTRYLPPSEPKIMLHAMCLKLVDLANDV